MKAKNYLHTLGGVMLLSFLYIQEAYSQAPPSCLTGEVITFEKGELENTAIEKKIQSERERLGRLPANNTSENIKIILNCLKEQNKQLANEKEAIKREIHELYTDKTILLENKDLSSLKKQIEEKKRGIQNIKATLKDQLIAIKLVGVYAVILNEGILSGKNKDEFEREAFNAITQQAITHLNGIFIETVQTYTSDEDGKNIQEIIKQSIKGNMEPISSMIQDDLINNAEKFLVILTVSVSPLKEYTTTTQKPQLPSQGYTLISNLEDGWDNAINYKNNEQKNLFIKRKEEFQSYAQKENESAKQKEKSIISAATDKITENNIELEALEKKYANKIKKIKSILENSQLTWNENNIDALINTAQQNIDTKIRNQKTKLLTISQNEWDITQPVPVKDLDNPVKNITSNIISTKNKLNEAGKSNLYENIQILENGKFDEQENKNLQVNKTIKKLWVYLSQDGYEYKVQTIAKYDILENQAPTEKDSDSDGIPDSRDNCPREYAKTNNGCPEADSDSDGIPDNKDECPKQYANTDNGCPEKDTDSDGIPDSRDECPTQYAKTNNGCPNLIRTFTGHSDLVRSVAFSPDGRYALSGSNDKTLKLWDVNTGSAIRTFTGHSNQVRSVAFSPDGRYALSGSNDNTLKLWDVNTGSAIRTFTGHSDYVLSVAFSPDGRYALSGSSDNTLKLWDVNTGRAIRTFTGHSNYVFSVAFSPDGRYALSGSLDNTLNLWDVHTGSAIRTFTGHSNLVLSVAFSPDGRYALSGSEDNTLKLWDVNTGRAIRTFTGHSHRVRSVAFSPDGRYALSGSGDNTLKLWDVNTGSAIRTFTGHSDYVLSVAFSPDGRYALSGSNDKTLKLWDLSEFISEVIPVIDQPAPKKKWD